MQYGDAVQGNASKGLRLQIFSLWKYTAHTNFNKSLEAHAILSLETDFDSLFKKNI